jgi:hypothetical protein
MLFSRFLVECRVEAGEDLGVEVELLHSRGLGPEFVRLILAQLLVTKQCPESHDF